MIYTGVLLVVNIWNVYKVIIKEEIHAHIHRTPFQLYTWDKNGRKVSMNKKIAIKMENSLSNSVILFLK